MWFKIQPLIERDMSFGHTLKHARLCDNHVNVVVLLACSKKMLQEYVRAQRPFDSLGIRLSNQNVLLGAT
jgi:hypothetical protein